MAAFTAKVAPTDDEPEEAKGLKTQDDLVDRLHLALDDALAVVEGIFNNTAKQLRVLNLLVELNVTRMVLHYYVADGQIVIPEYLRGVRDVLVGESSRQEHVTKEHPQPDT